VVLVVVHSGAAAVDSLLPLPELLSRPLALQMHISLLSAWLGLSLAGLQLAWYNIWYCCFHVPSPATRNLMYSGALASCVQWQKFSSLLLQRVQMLYIARCRVSGKGVSACSSAGVLYWIYISNEQHHCGTVLQDWQQ
jgi:hypothetical protein